MTVRLTVAFLVVIGGLVCSASAVFAHVEFGHEEHTEIYQDPATPVPGTGDVPFSSEQIRKYEAAIEALRKRLQEEDARKIVPLPALLISPRPSIVPSPAALFVDSDADGLIDAEEVRLGTNSLLADTDGDGTSDRDERLGTRNPLKAAPGDEVQFTPAHFTVTASLSTDYQISGVRVAPVDEGEALIIAGTGPPKIYLALFLASAPQVLLVKTDETGRFRAELQGGIEDGHHEVFAAFTDSKGDILERSASLLFSKQGSTIEVLEKKEALSSNQPSRWWSSSLSRHLILAVMALILLLAAFLSLSFAVWNIRHVRR